MHSVVRRLTLTWLALLADSGLKGSLYFRSGEKLKKGKTERDMHVRNREGETSMQVLRPNLVSTTLEWYNMFSRCLLLLDCYRKLRYEKFYATFCIVLHANQDQTFHQGWLFNFVCKKGLSTICFILLFSHEYVDQYT